MAAPTTDREVMAYSITRAARLPCYDILLNTKLNALFAPEGSSAQRSPFSILKSSLFTFHAAQGPTAFQTEINDPSSRIETCDSSSVSVQWAGWLAVKNEMSLHCNECWPVMTSSSSCQTDDRQIRWWPAGQNQTDVHTQSSVFKNNTHVSRISKSFQAKV